MKKILPPILLACVLCLAPHTSDAQSSKAKSGAHAPRTVAKLDAPKAAPSEPKPAEHTEAAAAGEKKGADDKPAESTGGFGFGGIGGDGEFPFELMESAAMEIDPDGMTVLTTKVRIKSKDFNISCDQLKMDNKSKMVYATGNPVRLDQGAAVQALCRNLVYNLDTRSATLENDASIIQDKGDQRMKATADVIKIDNSNNKGGQPKVSLIMRDRSNNLPKIEVLGKAGKTDGAKKAPKTQRVSEKNVDLIKVPSLSKAPGVD